MKRSLDDLARRLADHGVGDSSRRWLLKRELRRAAAPASVVRATSTQPGAQLLARPMKRRTMIGAAAGAVALTAAMRPASASALSCPNGDFACTGAGGSGGICCPNGTICCEAPGPGGDTIFTCCPSGTTCCSDPDGAEFCCGCETGQQQCGDDCCLEGEFCNPDGPVCCQSGQSTCGDTCCEPGEVCVDGQCLETCPQDTTRCDTECCDAGDVCDPDEGCVPKCPPGRQRCGSLCCLDDQVCRDGECVCADGLVACNGQCCPAGQHCVGGKCSKCPAGSVDCFGKCCPEKYGCNLETKECQCPTALCGDKCCGLDETCIDPAGGVCCQTENVCGDPTRSDRPGIVCCGPGQYCGDDQCEGCKRPLKSCGDSCCPAEATCKVFNSGAATVCECPADTTICGNKCCPSNQYCSLEGCAPCPSGQFGCGSTCCPKGTVCTSIGTLSRCDCPDGMERCATGCCAKDPVELELGRAVPPARLVASKNGTVAIPVSCGGSTPCTGTLTLEAINLRKPRKLLPSKLRRTALAKKNFRVAAGKKAKVKVRLPRGYRKQLVALGRIRADALVTSRGADGRKVARRSRAFNLDAP